MHRSAGAHSKQCIIDCIVTIPHPGLIAVAVVVLSIPVVAWIAGRVSRALARYDARAAQQELALIAASVDAADSGSDSLTLIESLAHDEIMLIREVLELRATGEHVSPELAAALRRMHRRGLAARQRCGDPALDAELGWLQGYGSLALMADLAELGRADFEHDLDHRAAELRRALILRRARLTSDR